jgi:aldose sugar dehydrogenase
VSFYNVHRSPKLSILNKKDTYFTLCQEVYVYDFIMNLIASSSSCLILIGILILSLVASNGYYFLTFPNVYGLKQNGNDKDGPKINDPNLKIQTVFKGLKWPTSMAFLGPNDILVLEKNDGTVRRIVNGIMLPQPLLDVNVATMAERGMLGIAIARNYSVSSSTGSNKITTFVFLYYTEAPTKDGDDVTDGKKALGNRLYRYELVNNKLVNPKLLLSLPLSPTGYHNGGRIIIGPDNNIYLVVGDIQSHQSKAQNYLNGSNPDGRSGILRVTQEGKPVVADGGSILANTSPLNLYYSYGLLNSFGLDFDPITKKLWDTENGPAYGDEINLVYPGFNSGWRSVQGIWEPNYRNKLSHGFTAGNITLLNPDNNNKLVDFGGKGKYSPPELTWYETVGPTGIKFLNSSKLGVQYQNDMFIGTVHGYLFHFDLNENRTQLLLKGVLADKVVNNANELLGGQIIFGQDFGGISDLQVGPSDGYLYILSIYSGDVYRIVPAAS